MELSEDENVFRLIFWWRFFKWLWNHIQPSSIINSKFNYNSNNFLHQLSSVPVRCLYWSTKKESIWDSVKGLGRVWEGMCNLPSWERQRNSHGFLLRMWESDPMAKHLLVISKRYINLPYMHTVSTTSGSSHLVWGFWCFCCLGPFFFQVSWKANASLHVNIKTCFLSVST